MRADAIEVALKARRPETVFDGRELALLEYAAKLTLKPGEMLEDDIKALRKQGVGDG